MNPLCDLCGFRPFTFGQDMTFKIRNAQPRDRESMVRIINYFIRESFAAYPEKEISTGFFAKIISNTRVCVILEIDGKIGGFGFIRPYHESANFNHTGILTYFILPQYTNKGLGSKMLKNLMNSGHSLGITNFVAHISSKNQQSLRFHRKHGFQECGRLKNMGVKFGDYFDIVWVQKQMETVDKSE